MGSIRIVKKRARPFILPAPVPVPGAGGVKDDKTVRTDMLRKIHPSPMNSERHREQNLQKRLKCKLLKVESDKKQENRSDSVPSGIRIKFCGRTDSPRLTQSQKGEVAVARLDDDHRVAADDDCARKDEVETWEKYGSEAVEAALILMDYSWEAWGLLKKDSHDSSEGQDLDNNNFLGSEKKSKKLENFHEENLGPKQTGRELAFPLPQKKRKFKYIDDDDDVVEEDESYERSRNSATKERIQAEHGSSNGSTTKKSSLSLVIHSSSVHPGFSFSIIHLLTAIRVAMITSDAGDYDPSTYEKLLIKKSSKTSKRTSSTRVRQQNFPFLTLNEIVGSVRSNPGDPLILETKEPLQDLVKGALKKFSLAKAPQGAKHWEPLTLYAKSKKCWSWIGPVPSKPDIENLSAEAWGLPHKTLQKLVNSFADWLKSAQETLQIIGSLPSPPPRMSYPSLSIQERLTRLKPRSAGATIYPVSEQVRSHFRVEEAIRYLIPDHAFHYTALDGKKSAVAPMRQSVCGKPSNRCREHFMLKADRPPTVTILSLVRDAAARLPDGVGTRADVCILMRDSQYIVEDIPEEQLFNVASGGLDRLHYENDPCVRFDGKNRLWFYLHRERDEDEFEEDGTVSVIRRTR